MMTLPNRLVKQVSKAALQAPGCDLGGLQLCPQRGRAQPAPARTGSLSEPWPSLICLLPFSHLASTLPSALAVCKLPFLQPLGHQSKLCSQQPLGSRYFLSSYFRCQSPTRASLPNSFCRSTASETTSRSKAQASASLTATYRHEQA